MTQVAIITDIHFDVKNGSRYFLDRYEEFFDQVFFPTLKERGINQVLILGDTWEYRVKVGSYSLHRAQQMFFDRLESEGIKAIMIYGNHDVAYRSTNEVNTVDFLGKMYPNVQVIPTHATLDIGGCPINFLSWVNNQNYEESIRFMESCPPTVLCGHFEIKGFEMYAGHVCHSGFDRSIFDRFDMVLLGHFHTPSTDGKITYIGNPFYTNWSDYNDQRGFRILHTDTLKMEFIENPFKVYEKIAYTQDLQLDGFEFETYQNKIVRVYVQAYNKKSRNKLDIFMEKLGQVAYSTEMIVIDDTVENAQEVDLDSIDNRQLIVDYITEVVDNDQLDKQRLIGMFDELYQEAASMVETE